MINFDSCYKYLAGQTLQWLPTDTHDIYLENLKNNRHKLEMYGWIDAVIEYKFNSHGFRSDEFTDGPNAMFLGCSHTIGIGLPSHARWTEHVAQRLNLKCCNLGIGGSSPDTAFRLCLGWIDKIKPKIVVFRAPPGIRLEHVSDTSAENITISTLHDIPENQWLFKWAMDDNNYTLNYLKNVSAMKFICQQKSIKFVEVNVDERFGVVDSARDLCHTGVNSNKRFADLVMTMI